MGVPFRPITNGVIFLKKWAIPGHFFVYFQSFQTNITIFTTIWCEKCPSSIWCWDLNPQSLDRGSLPITTRPGLPPKYSLRHWSSNCQTWGAPNRWRVVPGLIEAQTRLSSSSSVISTLSEKVAAADAADPEIFRFGHFLICVTWCRPITIDFFCST